ncbi:MAG: hypothetical protein ACJ8C4_07480 [Gemmataceae bacterium]
MTNETAFLLALAISLTISFAVVLYLRGPLQRVLVDLCGAEHRASFWTAYSNTMMILVPLAALLLARHDGQYSSAMFAIIEHLKAALVGLIISVFLIAMGVAAFIRPGRIPVAVSPAQVDSLEWMLRKVEAMRAAPPQPASRSVAQ